MPDAPITVTNNRDTGRLEVHLGDEVAFAEYRITRGGIVFPHTVVPRPSREGAWAARW